ncbi:hypothetical protein MM326_13955 [Alkalihalobacillus sp. LMS6]|uniref:hypothetical protein n=1 Tax=Alkalihalobacillus sp. LMS6 TaxID=2924034 RepID=UPI0020D1B2AB|nr:hypothetical protein [Alkalihalobacillus sp. LMS6]UTR05207.1 hypothetical protein MM326_13955 [Alkalihalobacillus sp. LMS6]
MIVYLVEKDNGESYEDYEAWVDGVYSTFRKASESLLEDGYTLYYESLLRINELRFYRRESDEYLARVYDAKIIEMEVDARD